MGFTTDLVTFIKTIIDIASDVQFETKLELYVIRRSFNGCNTAGQTIQSCHPCLGQLAGTANSNQAAIPT